VLARFIWEKKQLINRLPFAYSLYTWLMTFKYRDGMVITIRRGPAAGYKWRHYRVYQPWMAMGMYEPHVTWFIYDQLKPGDIFYDIGANAGYFTLVAAKAVVPRVTLLLSILFPRTLALFRSRLT